MTLHKSFRHLAGAAVLALLAGMAHAQDLGRIEIIAPSGSGGGYDLTARSIQASLEELELVRSAQVTNISGASGTVGLAQFVASKNGRDNAFLVVGLVLEGGILLNKSPVNVEDLTPVARLLGEYDLLVVRAPSDIQTLDDLVAKLKENPESVSWAGGIDHILAGLIGEAVGVDPTRINYVAHDGGGQALASILGGHVTVGVNGAQEMLPHVASGKLRALAISSPERLEGVDVPTLKEGGVDVELVNWRGIVAPPGINEDELKVWRASVEQMVASPGWQSLLAERGWIDLYQPPEEFTAFIAEDSAQTAEVLKGMGLVQ